MRCCCIRTERHAEGRRLNQQIMHRWFALDSTRVFIDRAASDEGRKERERERQRKKSKWKEKEREREREKCLGSKFPPIVDVDSSSAEIQELLLLDL